MTVNCLITIVNMLINYTQHAESDETIIYYLLRFIFTLLNSENLHVSDIVAHLLQFSSSTIAENYRYLSFMYNITPDDWINGISCVLRKVKSPDILSDEYAINVSVVES